MNIIEEKLTSFTNKHNLFIDREKCDFIGVNADLLTGDFSIKYYKAPVSCLNVEPRVKSELMNYIIEQGMARFYWNVIDESGVLREYMAMINRSDEKMTGLFTRLENDYSTETISEIKTLSKMHFTDRHESIYSSLYIIGTKGEDGRTLNLEWFTRNCPDPDDVGYNYSYDDDYYLNYINAMGQKGFENLIDISRELLDDCRMQELHLWTIAADYSDNGTNKYKIYFKGNGCNNINFVKMDSNLTVYHIREEILSELEGFRKLHSDLVMHGFALSRDSKERYGLNIYFKVT